MGEGSGSQTWFGSCCFAPIRLAPGPFLGCESAQTHRGTCWEVSSGHGCPAQDWTRSGGLLRGPTPGQGRESWLREKTEDVLKECWERVRAAIGTQTWPKARGSTAPEAPPQGLAEAPGIVLPGPCSRTEARCRSYMKTHTGAAFLHLLLMEAGRWLGARQLLQQALEEKEVRPRCGAAQPGLLTTWGPVWTSADCACAFQAIDPGRSQSPRPRRVASNKPLLGASGQATKEPAGLGLGLQLPQNQLSGCLRII